MKNIFKKFINFIKHNYVSRKIKHFFNNLKRSSKWFVRMWGNYDWDSIYLIEMMVDKMKDMRYQLDVVDSWFVDLRHQPSTMSPDCEETVDNLKELDEVIEIGERLIKSDYIVYSPEVEEWEKTHNLFDDDIPDDIRESMRKSFEKSHEDEKNDNNRFWELIRDNHYKWWS